MTHMVTGGLMLALTAMASGTAVAETRPLSVLATVAMLGDVAQNVGGSCVQVETLMGPGSDPHLYNASAADVVRLAEADLILYVDPALEARLAQVLSGLADRRPTLGVVRAAGDELGLLEDPDAAGQIDPHLWMDVSRWSATLPAIAGKMIELRPDCADQIAADLDSYRDKLAALHDWVGAAIGSIPEGQRLLVTAHDAFGYFADAYGIEASEAIEGISTESEASIRDIRDVAAFVAERGVPAVFVESTINPRTIEALVAELHGQGHDVAIGGQLFSDAMGDAGTPEGTYIGMIRANVMTITTALGGSVPDWPDALGDWQQEWFTAE